MSQQTVSFRAMRDGTKEDYLLLQRLEEEHNRGLPDRLLEAMAKLDESLPGYRITRLAHSLQSATHAHENDESEEMVVAALLHDIGDELAPQSHSEMAAAVLRPYVSEKIYWIIKHHGVFQMYYYAHHLGLDRNARDRFKGHRWYDDSVRFCELYDENCFDPDYPHKPLEFFEPMVRRVFSAPPFGETRQ